jgi:hypothetical protein
MSIEVKQLVIKSTIVDEDDDENSDDNDTALMNLKQEMLSECRRLFAEMLIEKGQR